MSTRKTTKSRVTQRLTRMRRGSKIAKTKKRRGKTKRTKKGIKIIRNRRNKYTRSRKKNKKYLGGAGKGRGAAAAASGLPPYLRRNPNPGTPREKVPVAVSFELIRHGPSGSNVMAITQSTQDYAEQSAAVESVGMVKRAAVSTFAGGKNPDLNHFIKDISLCHVGICWAIQCKAQYYAEEGGNVYYDFVLCSNMLRAIQTSIFLFPKKKIYVVPFINEEAAQGIERQTTFFARSPYELDLVKKRVEMTMDILMNPKLIHFGGDRYTLDKVKEWRDDLDDTPNVDYSIYEDIKTRYGANEEPILKSCPELFYKMVLPLILKENIGKVSPQNTLKIPIITHGYTLRNKDPEEGLLTYMHGVPTAEHYLDGNAAAENLKTLITTPHHMNTPNIGSMLAHVEYNDIDVDIPGDWVSTGIPDQAYKSAMPKPVFQTTQLNNGFMNGGAVNLFAPFPISYKDDLIIDMNDNKEHGREYTDKFSNFAQRITSVSEEAWFCYWFMHQHDDLTGSWGGTETISTADCCSPTEYFLKYCGGENPGSASGVPAEDSAFELKLSDMGHTPSFSCSDGRQSFNIDDNFMMSSLAGAATGKRRLLYVTIATNMAAGIGTQVNKYYIPGIGLKDRIFDGVFVGGSESGSEPETFIRRVVGALRNKDRGVYDKLKSGSGVKLFDRRIKLHFTNEFADDPLVADGPA
jgi:hypothetical protein